MLSEVKVVQSHPTLCNPMDYIVHGILQARILEWVAFSFSRVPFLGRGKMEEGITVWDGTGDLGSIPGLGRCPGEGKGYPLHYSGLENSMDYIVHGAADRKSTRLNSSHTDSSRMPSSA